MLKLFLYSSIIIPCAVIPFMVTADIKMPNYDTSSFEEAYVEPEFDKLERCETAELDVFFHENYITFHSAEYLSEGVKVAESCGQANFVVTPIIPFSSGYDAEAILSEQSKELSLILDAHGINAKINSPKIDTEFNTLSANGRAAKIKISFGAGESA